MDRSESTGWTMEALANSVATSLIASIPLVLLFSFSMRTFVAGMMAGELGM